MSEQTDSKVPQIRFKGFTEDWIEMPMAELLSFKNGYNAGGEQYGTGEKFINVLDIIENDYITHDRIIGRVNISDEDFKKNEVTYGDILFQRSSETREEVGQANVYLDQHKSATFGGFVIRGKPTGISQAAVMMCRRQNTPAFSSTSSRAPIPQMS
jgi:type I restriction enzyme S subunit